MKQEKEERMKLKRERLIVSVETEAGSKGNEVAKELAETLCIPCYEEEVIREASEISGIPFKLLKRYEDRTAHLAYDLTAEDESGILIPPAKYFLMAQIAACRMLAEHRSCILVDHHSNAALSGRDNHVRVFVHADPESRQKEFALENGIEPGKAKNALSKEDRRRRRYFRSVSRNWGKAGNYDLTVNSSQGSPAVIAGHIVDYLQTITEERLVHPTWADRLSA